MPSAEFSCSIKRIAMLLQLPALHLELPLLCPPRHLQHLCQCKLSLHYDATTHCSSSNRRAFYKDICTSSSSSSSPASCWVNYSHSWTSTASSVRCPVLHPGQRSRGGIGGGFMTSCRSRASSRPRRHFGDYFFSFALLCASSKK